jgi:hypothetical protein
VAFSDAMFDDCLNVCLCIPTLVQLYMILLLHTIIKNVEFRGLNDMGSPVGSINMVEFTRMDPCSLSASLPHFEYLKEHMGLANLTSKLLYQIGTGTIFESYNVQC